MAFQVEDRVQVSDQSSQYRNHYGVVKSVDGDDVEVRTDGMQASQTALFKSEELRPSTQPIAMTY